MILHLAIGKGRSRAASPTLAAVLVLASCLPLNAQSFYQVYGPRTYRIDPATTPPLPDNLVPQMLTYRTAGGNGAGTLILSWNTTTGEPSQVLEVAVDLALPPPPGSENDATLISQIPALQIGTSIDYQSDRQVLVMSRTIGTRQAVIERGAFQFDTQGGIIGVETDLSITPSVVSGGLGTNLGPQGVAFSGVRNIAGGVYATATVIFAGEPAGLWASDLSSGQWLDANLQNTGGANAISPLVGWSGNTGVTNQDPGGHLLRGVDVVGDIAFLLTARQQNPNDAGSTEYYLIQVNLLVSERLAVVNLGELFDSRITSPSEALGGDLDVTPISETTVRITLSTPGSGKYIGVLDGRFVPIGSDPIAPEGSQPSENPAIIWVCPGFGIIIASATLATGLYLFGTGGNSQGRKRRKRPPDEST